MHTTFRESLDAEIRRLETELANDPRAIQLQELKRVRDFYQSQGTAGVTIVVEPAPSDKPGRKMAPERIQALSISRELLKGKAEPIKTADILAHLESRGIKIGGSDPQSNLSAMFYHQDDF